MQSWRDLCLSTLLLGTCVAMPQVTGMETMPLLVALIGCFSLIWRLARVQTDQEERDLLEQEWAQKRERRRERKRAYEQVLAESRAEAATVPPASTDLN